MKMKVLVQIRESDGRWEAIAYQGEAPFCVVDGSSRERALAKIAGEVKRVLVPQVESWLSQWKYGDDPRSPNCPEGAVKLPIDIWVCKLVDQNCPIQATVLLDERERFFRHCLAPEPRKRQIFNTVAQGKYHGFHHVPGRYLCPRCQEEKKKQTFEYHYPWELTQAKAYFELSSQQQWDAFRVEVVRRGLNPAIRSAALCAQHCKEIAELLDPPLGARLTMLELDIRVS